MIVLKFLPENIIIAHWITFLISTFVAAILVRATLSFFKAWAIAQGEADRDDGEKYKGERNYKLAFKQSFCSNSGNRNVDDHWLPFWIGLIELNIYPVLMATDNWKSIGFWVGVKAANQLVSWQKSRTPFNRFLLGNLLGLLIAYWFSLNFVCVSK